MRPLYKTKAPAKAAPAKAARPARGNRAPVATPAPGVEFKPVVRFEPVMVPLGNGKFEVTAGKPIVSQADDEIDTAEFAKHARITQSYCQQLCSEGAIVARRMSGKKRSKFLISLSELTRYIEATKGTP